MTETSGPAPDTVTGYQLLNPTNVVPEQVVDSWAVVLPDALHVIAQWRIATAYCQPSVHEQSTAIKFNGLSDALKYASGELGNDNTGDVYIVAQFTGGGDYPAMADTLFSTASDNTEIDYVFFAAFNLANTPTNEGGGTPLFRYRFRNDTNQTDERGSQVVIQTGVTYVMHFWGMGPGQGLGMSINGLGDKPYYTTNPAGYPTTEGEWFGASANLTNMTIGDFERLDGPQGFAAAYISEIDVFDGTPSQPVLPAAQSAGNHRRLPDGQIWRYAVGHGRLRVLACQYIRSSRHRLIEYGS